MSELGSAKLTPVFLFLITSLVGFVVFCLIDFAFFGFLGTIVIVAAEVVLPFPSTNTYSISHRTAEASYNLGVIFGRGHKTID